MAKKAAPQSVKACSCPYCEAEIVDRRLPYCQACHVEIVRCNTCLTVIPKGKDSCPSCGRKVKKTK